MLPSLFFVSVYRRACSSRVVQRAAVRGAEMRRAGCVVRGGIAYTLTQHSTQAHRAQNINIYIYMHFRAEKALRRADPFKIGGGFAWLWLLK